MCKCVQGSNNIIFHCILYEYNNKVEQTNEFRKSHNIIMCELHNITFAKYNIY